MRKRLTVLALALLAVAGIAFAQANVSSRWVSGNLVFYDKAGNIIATFDGTNRKLEIPSGSSIDLDAATTTVSLADGTIGRAKLTEDALAIVEHIALTDVTQADLDAIVSGTADDGEFSRELSTNVAMLVSDPADNETETQTGRFSFRLPENYVAAGDVKVRFRTALIESAAAATDNGSSIDLSCYEQASGAVGADIVSTAAQTFAATDTWYDKDFSLTATNLIAGDLVVCLVTAAVIENNAGVETITLKSDPPAVLCDVKG